MFNRNMIKNIIISIVIVGSLTGLIFFIFRDNLNDIHESLISLSFGNIFVLLALGVLYQLLDAWAQYNLIKNTVPSFRYSQAVELTYLGIFGTVALFTAGSFPLQVYYLHHYGIEVGQSAGLKTLNYAMHKLSIVIFVTLMFFAGRVWTIDIIRRLKNYLITGYILYIFIIVALLLLCTWNRAHEAALWLLSRLPDHGPWKEISVKIKNQLNCMYMGTNSCVKEKRKLLNVLMIDMIKLGVFCMIPYICVIILDGNIISIVQAELLTSLMLLISGVVPNVAGLGPIEIVFFMVYRSFLGDVLTSSTLILFRIATYYFPFVLSVFFVIAIQIRRINRKKEN